MYRALESWKVYTDILQHSLPKLSDLTHSILQVSMYFFLTIILWDISGNLEYGLSDQVRHFQFFVQVRMSGFSLEFSNKGHDFLCWQLDTFKSQNAQFWELRNEVCNVYEVHIPSEPFSAHCRRGSWWVQSTSPCKPSTSPLVQPHTWTPTTKNEVQLTCTSSWHIHINWHPT